MKRWREAVAASMVLALAPLLLAQFNPYAPFVPVDTDPRARRALRERAVAYAGVESREFVETLGDPAVAALFACSQAGARKLVEFHNAGRLARLPRPADLLRVIAQPGHGDDVVIYALQAENELTDVDHFDAYLLNPLEYAYGLRRLSEGAVEARARRLSAQAAAAPWQVALDGQKMAAGAAILGLILLLWWRRHHGA